MFVNVVLVGEWQLEMRLAEFGAQLTAYRVGFAMNLNQVVLIPNQTRFRIGNGDLVASIAREKLLKLMQKFERILLRAGGGKRWRTR